MPAGFLSIAVFISLIKIYIIPPFYKYLLQINLPVTLIRSFCMITFLKVLFSAIFIWISYTVITTCLKSNLFTEWDFLGSIPWMRATLWDFYANVTVIFVWVCYKENRVLPSVLWLLLLFCLGSIASCAYVLIQLFKLKPGEGLKELFGKQYAK